MIVNTGATIILLTKMWSDAYDLIVKEKLAEYSLGANGIAVKIISMTSMTLFLAPTLEVDVANIAIYSGNFYQGLLGCDLLFGHNEVLGTATITLPGLD